MSTDPFVLATAGVMLGGVAAQSAGPVAWNWHARKGALKHRLLALPRSGPRLGARLFGGAAIGLVLASGALVAYAAQPSGPDALPGEAVGVVGSGQTLSLKVAQDQKIRTVEIGQDYRDGWKLDGLTTSEATLSKDGKSRKVGLNPSGALAPAPPTGAPANVQIAGDTLEARRAYEDSVIQDYWKAFGITNGGIKMTELAAYLGEVRYQAFLDNGKRLGQLARAKSRADALARGDFNTVRYYDYQPVAGPDGFDVPRGMSAEQAAQAIGLTGSLGYSMDALASGTNGRGMVMVKCYTPTTPASAINCPKPPSP